MKGDSFGRGGYKKHFNGKFGETTKGTRVVFGDLGLIALDSVELSQNVIQAMMKAAKRSLKDVGRAYMRINPDYSVTKKVKDSTLGAGVGKFDRSSSFVKKGKVLLEVSGLDLEELKKILIGVSYKCPCRTLIIGRREKL